MKKELILLFILCILIFGCDSASDIDRSANLNDFQEQACNSADEHESCDKLKDMGIVSKEECCKELDKCCQK